MSKAQDVMHEPLDEPDRAADAPWVKRFAAAATRYREAILAPRIPTLEMYTFGKHPAWRDFIDPSLLPAPPRPFQHFHAHLRAEAETAYARRGREPVVAAWRNVDNSAVLLILPSHDSADPFTGSARISPLFLGACIRGSLGELFRFSVPRLTTLSAYLRQEGRTADQFIAAVRKAARTWSADFDALCNGKPRPGPPPCEGFPEAVQRVWAYEAAAPQGCFLLLPETRLDIAFATAVGADSIHCDDFRAALARVFEE